LNVYAETNFVLELTAAECEFNYDLSPQDALVYASVVSHLRSSKPQQACFLNRNFKDFDSPDIVDALGQLNCRMIPSFAKGLDFIRAQTIGSQPQ
jgi:hypothetical protein